ncbi:MAG: hypothetical protein IPP66_23090 [Anaerolineales bacterium]|nr:hypothetical protein [Anaerolineales bacterium]
MQSFIFSDAVRFKLLTQQDDTSAKVQVFVGVFLGVILRWIYSVAVEAIKSQSPWVFGVWYIILARIVVALVTTLFVFSGYWQKAKDMPSSLRFWNSLAYGISIDALVGPWMS